MEKCKDMRYFIIPVVDLSLANIAHLRLLRTTIGSWQCKTRTTRTLAFWGYLLLPHDYPYKSYWTQSQNKTKSKSQIQRICQKLKFWNFEINFACNTPSEVEERTWFCPQTDVSQYEQTLNMMHDTKPSPRGRLHKYGQTDRQGETSIPTLNFVERRV